MADVLQPHVSKIRIPNANDRIWKDECVFSFDTPESEHGLYVCLNTYLGFGRNFVERYFEKTGNGVFLHLRRIKREIAQPASDDGEQPKKITKLAIGIEGGFDANAEAKRFEVEEVNSIAVLPGFVEVSLNDPEIPMSVLQAVSAVLASDSATKQEELLNLAGTWDGETRQVSKFAANLEQHVPPRKISPNPKDWKCDNENCDKTENLWLNLTDGSILCGRKYFDGTGGNNHAVEHYAQVKHPLAVKLGTISPNGADVYSYAEDDMVEDPFLTKHLEHFGIKITDMQKTEKSMVELELDANNKLGEWSTITEANQALAPLFGPGYTGLANLGNSCYLNSVMQVLFTIPEFINTYHKETHFINAPNDPTQDFNAQMAKLAFGLLSGAYSREPATGPKEQEGIKPIMFKNLVGRGHPEFSTKRQQDAQEFFLHLINMTDRNSRLQADGNNPTQCLSFQVEERIECTASKKVKYTTRNEYLLPLPIPLDKASNLSEYQEFENKKKLLEIAGERLPPNEEIVRAKIPLAACIEAFAEAETIEDFYSTAINGKTVAKKSSKLKTFPDYLMIQLKKFALGDDWVPKKLDVDIEVPDVIDLAHLRSKGQQPGEEPLPEQQGAASAAVAAPAVVFDQAVLAQVMEMGFGIDSCKRALHNTQNAGVEAAVSWLFEHNGDADFNDPFTLDQPSVTSGGGQAAAGSFVPDPNGMEALKAMGLPEEHAILGLKATSNNVERAIDWIFSHPDELAGGAMETDDSQPAPGAAAAVAESAPSFRDGAEKYRLVAFISHMGTSTLCGHYVCHIRKEERWVIYNDNKVAVSEQPPKGLGYLYLYQRM